MRIAGGEITIGVVGASDVVHRVMAVARDAGDPSWRLVAAVYGDEKDAHAQVMKIVPRIDVCLFAGLLPYDVAKRRGDFPVPATYAPVDGAALYGALLRGNVERVFDPLKVSVDTLSPMDLRTAYHEVGLDASDVHVQQYVRPESADEFLAFHRSLFESGKTTGAVTTVPTVAAALAEAGVPSMKMTPSGATLRNALHAAALIGSGTMLEESRIVTMIVRIPDDVLPPHASPTDYWYQDLKLSLHRELLREARPMDATVLARDEHSYLIVTTMGSLNIATEDLTVMPFLGRISTELGFKLEVGIGLGTSTREAERNAQAAVDKTSASDGHTAYLMGPGKSVLQLPSARQAESPPPTFARDPKAVDILHQLAEKLTDEDDDERIVDAEKVAALMGVTLRTARRMLQALVDEGLAWPTPLARTSKVGRPRRPYQLLIEGVQNRDTPQHQTPT